MEPLADGTRMDEVHLVLKFLYIHRMLLNVPDYLYAVPTILTSYHPPMDVAGGNPMAVGPNATVLALPQPRRPTSLFPSPF